MLADVRPMRIDGRRIAREHLRSMQPIRGELSVTRRRDPWRDAWVPIALLSPQTPREIPALDQVRIARWTGQWLIAFPIPPSPLTESAHADGVRRDRNAALASAF